MNLIEAQVTAVSLLEKHGLLSEGWTFHFDNAKVRFGSCQYASKKITLSKKITELNEETEVVDTILHEIAHAIVGPRHGHNHHWKLTALSIGCNGKARYDGNTVIAPPKRFTGTCPNCDRKIQRDVRSGIACGTCCKGKYNSDYRFNWTRN